MGRAIPASHVKLKRGYEPAVEAECQPQWKPH
jgi:hypothetical protein